MQERLSSPVTFLASLLSERKSPKLVIVTGNRGTGKTAWCLELVRQSRLSRVNPAGLISPPIFQDGLKIGIDLVAITSGERRQLAEKREEGRSEQATVTDNLSWRFDSEVLDWGNRILEQLQPSELLILDELGPLEFLEGKGLMAGLKLVDSRRDALACIVVRPSLLHIACERWPWGETMWVREADQT